MKKKLIEITLTMILVAHLLTGCREHTEENGAKEAQISETENPLEDGLMPEDSFDEADESTAEAVTGEEQESEPEEQAQEYDQRDRI